MNLKFISGLADCHLPALFSFVLSDRVSPEAGMRRIFYTGGGCKMDLWDGADFRLKPHNHRQSISLTLLFGKAENVTLKFGQYGNDSFHVWKYKFGSALLNGKFDLERREEQLAFLVTEPLSSSPLRLHWSTPHTVTAEPGSAWLVEEYEIAPPETARCWSVSHRLELSNEGLYRQMGRESLDWFEKRLSKGNSA